jgi:phosphoglycerate dehydrogenase-like enzyme
MPRVLVSSGPLRNQTGRFREILQAAGHEIIDPDGHHQFSDSELASLLPGVDAVVAGAENYSAPLFDRCPRLRIIARTGVGYDAVDVDAATRRGILVTITPGTNHEAVAEQAFALIFGVTRRVALNDRIIRAGGWDRTLVPPLRGKTLGLVGLGRIGRAMIPRALAFGVSVIACEPAALDPKFPPLPPRTTLVDFETLLRESDIVSLHCPLGPATRHLFNRDAYARMKPTAFLINTARGGVVHEADLHHALVTRTIAGAGLDVLDPEPPDPANPLLGLDNVVISPHIAGIDIKSMADMAEKAARCIVELFEHASQPLDRELLCECTVNPECIRSDPRRAP